MPSGAGKVQNRFFEKQHFERFAATCFCEVSNKGGAQAVKHCKFLSFPRIFALKIFI